MVSLFLCNIKLLLDLVDLVVNVIIKLLVEFVLNILRQIVVEILLWIDLLLLIEHVQELVVLTKILWPLAVVAEVLEVAHVLEDGHISEVVVGNLTNIQVSKLIDIV